MATTDELVAQAQAATSGEQLDAIGAQSSDPMVTATVQARRDQLQPDQAAARALAKQPAPGANAVTEPPKPAAHYFEIADGDGGFRKVNAWGEEKGSPEDKKRW